MKKRKVNPRRIPLSKSMIDSKAILEEATKDDMYRAWLLAGNAIIELNLASIHELPEVADSVNRFIAASDSEKGSASEMRRAESMIGVQKPSGTLDPSGIHTQAELDAFKRKVYQLATYTALCVLYLGLEKSGRFGENELRRLFLNVDLTLAEIDGGLNSYTQLEKALGASLLAFHGAE